MIEQKLEKISFNQKIANVKAKRFISKKPSTETRVRVHAKWKTKTISYGTIILSEFYNIIPNKAKVVYLC